jgi:isoleucyl-tRNA synthetase
MGSSPTPFEKVSGELDFPREEKSILDLWREKNIFEKSIRGDKGDFVFYEGPPTANGLPHNGHVLTRVIKDLFPRYKTMCGYRVARKAGWDTHGLPVEVEVEKELHIHGKAAIEEYGVEPFIAKCIASVFRYTDEWEKLTTRIGFWVDLSSAYVTFHKSYVESVWWALSELHKKGLLYQGHKVVWWWAQGGTALSAGEVGQGYKTVDDPSVYVEFPLVAEPGTSLLVWTTTPWTLSSNMYAAVNRAFDYVVVQDGAKKYVVAEKLRETLEKKLKRELPVLQTLKADTLIGARYKPPFDLFEAEAKNKEVWRVRAADFVTLDAGTGIVHIAPAFGEDDHLLYKKLVTEIGAKAPELFCAVKPDGTFIDAYKPFAGRWVKEADKDIAQDLKARGLLVFQETYRHEYPFCWRADSDPLIQFARPAWYIRTTEKIQDAIANNQKINWLPEHIKDGRFGEFLKSNVDWALSRERFWGTPLPIWICDKCGFEIAPSSVAEIEKLGGSFDHFHAAKKADPSLNEHLIVHKPWIDKVTFACTKNCGGTMKRVSEVIDAWFDSGCMPFAQWGFPHQGRENFMSAYPADFISEGIDQTRGWFYTLLMIATLVFDDETQKRLGIAPVRPYPLPFKTCIVLGHVGDKDGKKESKSKGNYTPPEMIYDDVALDFAVVDLPAKKDLNDHVAFIAPEELEGLDLIDPSTVALASPANDQKISIELHAQKGLPRRVIVMSQANRDKLGVHAVAVPTKPTDVPKFAADTRVTVRPSMSAPGADAFRWFFYASNPPWSNTRHSLSNVRQLQKEFLIKLRNVYSFFVIYANIDNFDLQKSRGKKSELDNWITSELHITSGGVRACLDAYDVYGATQKLQTFVDALSNWYVRRSRERFWSAGWNDDKAGALFTLYEVLVETSKLIAPFTPFFAETMYQNLVIGLEREEGTTPEESVHLTSFPKPNLAEIDEDLSERIAVVRSVVSLGLQARTQAKIRVRQPLRSAKVIAQSEKARAAITRHEEMIREELNVLGVEVVTGAAVRELVDYVIKPSFRALGQRGLGKEAQQIKGLLAKKSPEEMAALHAELGKDGKITVANVELTEADLEISFTTKEGFAAAGGQVGVVVLETKLDEELLDLGLVRELLNRLQNARKELELDYTDRIHVTLDGSERLKRVVKAHRDAMMTEVLAVDIAIGSTDAPEIDVDGELVKLSVVRAPK